MPTLSGVLVVVPGWEVLEVVQEKEPVARDALYRLQHVAGHAHPGGDGGVLQIGGGKEELGAWPGEEGI